MISQTKTWLQKGTEKQAPQKCFPRQEMLLEFLSTFYNFISVFPDLADLEAYSYCMLW